MSETCQQEKTRNKAGRFLKGCSGNPSGSNGYTTIKNIEDALNDASKQKGYKDFPAYVASRAVVNDVVLIAVLKKVIPDLVRNEGGGNYTQVFAGLEPERLRGIIDTCRKGISEARPV